MINKNSYHDHSAQRSACHSGQESSCACAWRGKMMTKRNWSGALAQPHDYYWQCSFKPGCMLFFRQANSSLVFVIWCHSIRWLRLSYCLQLDHDLIPPSNREQVIFLGKGGRYLSTVITFKQRRYNCSQGGNDGNDGENTDGEEYFINGRGGGILQDFQ